MKLSDRLDRRRFLAGALGAVALGACARRRGAGSTPASALEELERRHGGRLGVAVVDVATGAEIGFRADERFPLCSTFKTLLAGAVLHRVDTGTERLDRTVTFDQRDLLEYAPTLRANLARGQMTIAELCEAAVVVSDNSAANLLLRDLGGPAGLTAYARVLGDAVTRLDRNEPLLNLAVPGDPRDTTTPRAMAEDLRRLLLEDALSTSSRQRLLDWHFKVGTGPGRLRAGVPPTARLAHKTGTGERGATNDVGVVWLPGKGPRILAAYYAESAAPLDRREAVLASVARLISAS